MGKLIVGLAPGLVASMLACSARASEGTAPLLVVVESPAGSDVGPRDVREAIAAELGTPVLGPGDAASDETADVLVVALGPSAVRAWAGSRRPRGAAPGTIDARRRWVCWTGCTTA